MANDDTAKAVRTATTDFDEWKRVVLMRIECEPTRPCVDCGGTGRITLLVTERQCPACRGLGLQPLDRIVSYTHYSTDVAEEESVDMTDDSADGESEQPLNPVSELTVLDPPNYSEGTVGDCSTNVKYRLIEAWDEKGNLVRNERLIRDGANWKPTEAWS